jgi:hypothetical protein
MFPTAPRTSVKIDHGKQCNLGLVVLLGLGLRHLLLECIQRGDVGVVMLAVMELHNLAGDGRLESAIVICYGILLSAHALSNG